MSWLFSLCKSRRLGFLVIHPRKLNVSCSYTSLQTISYIHLAQYLMESTLTRHFKSLYIFGFCKLSIVSIVVVAVKKKGNVSGNHLVKTLDQCLVTPAMQLLFLCDDDMYFRHCCTGSRVPLRRVGDGSSYTISALLARGIGCRLLKLCDWRPLPCTWRCLWQLLLGPPNSTLLGKTYDVLYTPIRFLDTFLSNNFQFRAHQRSHFFLLLPQVCKVASIVLWTSNGA
jgi:hypothetical protein